MVLSFPREEQLTVKWFLFSLSLFLISSMLFFRKMIVNDDCNIFPIVANLLLFCLYPLITDDILRRELFKLLILGIVVSIVNMSFSIVNYMEFSLYNFYSIMYALFYFCYIRQLNISNKVLLGYIQVIKYFLLFYFLLSNAEVVINNFFYENFYIQVGYIRLGIKIIILFITVLTIFSLIVEQKSDNAEKDVCSDSIIYADDVVLECNEQDQRLNQLRDSISQFFEDNTSYLDASFSLEDLCLILTVSNTQIVSQVIRNKLDTTFCELVAKYRIDYALMLMENEYSWKLDAISRSCGFRSINTFKKYFINQVGISPSLYRINLLYKKGAK